MNSSLVTRHSSLPCGAPRRKTGFTLVELLLVIAVMSILGTITVGTSRLLVQNSRLRRTRVARDALNVALHRYRTEYQEWPVSKSDRSWDDYYDPSQNEDRTSGGEKWLGVKNGCIWYGWKENNDRVFHALRKNGNPDEIRFIDDTTLYAKNGNKVVPLSEAGSGSHALYYAMKRDNKPAPYTVWICFDTDEAEVGPRDDGIQAGDEDSEDAKYGY